MNATKITPVPCRSIFSRPIYSASTLPSGSAHVIASRICMSQQPLVGACPAPAQAGQPTESSRRSCLQNIAVGKCLLCCGYKCSASQLFCCVCSRPWAESTLVRCCGCSKWRECDTLVLTDGLAERLLEDLCSHNRTTLACTNVNRLLHGKPLASSSESIQAQWPEDTELSRIMERWGFGSDLPFRRMWRCMVSALESHFEQTEGLRKKWSTLLLSIQLNYYDYWRAAEVLANFNNSSN